MPKFFYVSAIDGNKKYLIAGPYFFHSDALNAVDHVRDVANDRDPRAWFMAWGTAGSDTLFRTPLGDITAPSIPQPPGQRA